MTAARKEGAYMKYMAFVKVVGELLFFYGLLGWIYGIVCAFVHPSWLSASLSHLTPWLRQDTFTVLSFLISMLGFFMWRLAEEWAEWKL